MGFVRVRWCSIVLAAASCAACGDDARDGGDADRSCYVAVELSGGVSRKVRGSEVVACASQRNAGSGLDVLFVLADGSMRQFGLGIEDVLEGQTGPFPTQVDVFAEDGRHFASLCSVTIEKHQLESVKTDELGESRHYQVAGNGACASPAVTSNGSEEVAIGPFDFSSLAVWTD